MLLEGEFLIDQTLRANDTVILATWLTHIVLGCARLFESFAF